MMMDNHSFETIEAHIQAAYQRQDFQQALLLARQGLDRFPEQKPLLVYWQICMEARLDHRQACLDLLKEIMADGFWYSEFLLRESPSLKPLVDWPPYAALINANGERRALESGLYAPLLTLRPEGECSKGQAPCAMLIGLHSNASTAMQSLPIWQPAVRAGWLVAAPQSSQAMWRGAYFWTDPQTAETEVLKHLETIQREYEFGGEPVVYAGHSMGGEVAIRLALTGSLAVNGFLAVGPGGPWMDDPSAWHAEVDAGRTRGVRGYIIVGEKDQSISLKTAEALADQLLANGIACDFEAVPNAGHNDSERFAPALLRGLEYIQSVADELE
jgi:predicted esterase